MGLRLAALFVVGTLLGSLVNWAIYTLAWNPRPISPWSPPPEGAAPRSWFDRLPVFGWLQLRREAEFHGRWFWLRPLLLEIATGAAIAVLYWWEIGELGLIRGQFAGAINPPYVPLHFQYLSHVLLLCLMLAASFIDIDEKIIPDEITLPGTLLGLALATALPMSLLPQLVARPDPQLLGLPVAVANNQRVYLEPVTAIAPNPWPPEWGAAGNWQSLMVALACYWLWCFALTPRIWRGRRGPIFAVRLISARVRQAFAHRPIRELFWAGTAVIGLLWMLLAQSAWAGLVTALIGLAASGGIVWAVRLIGTAALRREAMGFGDVTLMMMIGTFIGWQAGLVAFFLAPFAGLVIGLLQFALRRDDVIPYGPFLCLGSAVVIVAWAPIWEWAAPLFGQGLLVPAVLIICLALLGIMLAIWQAIKNALFGRGA